MSPEEYVYVLESKLSSLQQRNEELEKESYDKTKLLGKRHIQFEEKINELESRIAKMVEVAKSCKDNEKYEGTEKWRYDLSLDRALNQIITIGEGK